jgi:hypothetical protein
LWYKRKLNSLETEMSRAKQTLLTLMLPAALWVGCAAPRPAAPPPPPPPAAAPAPAPAPAAAAPAPAAPAAKPLKVKVGEVPEEVIKNKEAK